VRTHIDYHANIISITYRVPSLDSNSNGRLQHQSYGPSENGRLSCRSSSGSLDSMTENGLQHQSYGLSEKGRLSCRSSSGSLDSMTENGAVVAELHNGVEETGWNGSRMPVETRGVVNSNGSPKTNSRLEVVNNRESSRTEAQLKFVNNNNEGLKMENQFENEEDEFD